MTSFILTLIVHHETSLQLTAYCKIILPRSVYYHICVCIMSVTTWQDFSSNNSRMYLTRALYYHIYHYFFLFFFLNIFSVVGSGRSWVHCWWASWRDRWKQGWGFRRNSHRHRTWETGIPQISLCGSSRYVKKLYYFDVICLESEEQ